MDATTVEIHDSNAIFRWQMALLLLSLDRVTPFWDDLVLTFNYSERVKEAIQAYVYAQQKYDDVDDDDLDYSDKVSSLISKLLGNVRKIEGDAGPKTIRDWIEQRFIVYELENWRSVWQTLLRRLANSGAPVLLHRGMPPEKLSKLIELGETWIYLADTINNRIEKAERQPLEGWDKEQYAYYRREGADISPLDHLASYLRNSKFDQIWRQILQLLNPHEMDLLNDWGQIETTLNTSIQPRMAEIPSRYQILS